MVQEKYFEEVALPNFFIIGAIVKINLNNGRYAMHRITDILPWKLGADTWRTSIITTPITKEFKHTYQDGGFLKVNVWSERELIAAMALTTLEGTDYGMKVTRATLWEHDALQPETEIWYTHLS